MTEQNTLSISELEKNLEEINAAKIDFEKNLQLAEQGDADAQFKLALIYRGILRHEFKVKQDATQADEWIKKAAEAGHPDAQYDLGICYSKGFGVEQNYAQAVYWHKKAAEQGNINSQDILGFYYYSEQDYQQAIDWFKKAAEQGDYFAQYRLACCYRDGVGVEQNNQLTFEWFNKCAESYAKFGRGRFLKYDDSYFYEDIGFFKDSLCDDIYYRVADCYFNGVGVEINQKKGIEWLEEAEVFVMGEQYSVPASVDYLYDNKDDYIFGITYGESEKKLIQQWRTESHQGSIETQYRLAVAYFKGNIKDDHKDTLTLYHLNDALQNNHPAAHQWLENTYLNFVFPYFSGREDIEQCYKFAFEWLLNGHGQTPKDFEINFGLAVLYAFGKGVEKNQELAIKHFKACMDETHRIYGSDVSEEFTEIFYNFSDLYKDLSEKTVERYYFDVLAPFFREGKSITGNAKQSNAVLPSLRIAFHLQMGEFELLKEFLNSFEDLESSFKYTSSKKNFKDMGLTVNKQAEVLKEINRALKKEIVEKEALYKALHEKEKEMLSFFTHTMRNALATAPESLRQAIQLLGGEVYEKDTKHYQAINKIAALFSTLSLTDCLIDTFKQSISDPQEYRHSWQNDHTGEATPRWVIASALRQALNRIIFMSDTTELRKLLNNPETALIKATRKSFIEEVLPLNVDSLGVEAFYSWTLAHIPAVDVSISDSDTLNFGVNQIRFSLLFAITSELILNALKYWDGENRIQIAWQLAEQGGYVFSVKNHCQANASSNLAGTHKGLAFIKRLVELLGEQAQFVCKSEGQLFTAELILTKA